MDLPEIEKRLASLHNSINLRPTLERAAEIGELLIDAKSKVKHGEWWPWLKTNGLRPRTAWDYIAVARHSAANPWPSTDMGIKDFLMFCRSAKKWEVRKERQLERDKLAKELGILPDSVHLKNIDCRKFTWPNDISVVCADPPWDDMGLYDWVGGMAANHLRDGGILLAQCGHPGLNQIFPILSRHLSYLWCLCLYYGDNYMTQEGAYEGGWMSSWKPVLVFCRGARRINNISDVFSIRTKLDSKKYHDWQQPDGGHRYWLSKWTSPGDIVADPFAGSGTIAVLAKELHLTYYGTEIDKRTYRIARGRIMEKL